jgi:hypothetical protein
MSDKGSWLYGASQQHVEAWDEVCEITAEMDDESLSQLLTILRPASSAQHLPRGALSLPSFPQT